MIDLDIFNKEKLKEVFSYGIKENKKYIGVLIFMEGFEKPEIIVNERENFESKLNYYIETYDDELIHKFSRGIKIIGAGTGSDFKRLEKSILGIKDNKDIEVSVALRGVNTIKYELEEITKAVNLLNDKYDMVLEKQNRVKSKVALDKLGV